MAKLLDFLKKPFSVVQPLPSGMFHYISPPDDPRNYRLHLRLEQDGSGVLIINASTILHLNQSAAEYAYYLIKNKTPQEVARAMSARYQVGRKQAEFEYQELVDRVLNLIDTPDLDPVTYLGFERVRPFTGHITAPYRLDCAITYQLPESPLDDAAPHDQVDRELTATEWKTIIDKAWDAGIPHIIFTGGEPTLHQDLPELIAHAESNDQITGLLTDGLRFTDMAYLESLLQTGLDHVLVLLQPNDERSWQALTNALAADLFVAVHLTLTDQNKDDLPGLINKLAGMGVGAVSLSTHDSNLNKILENLRELIANLHLDLVWNLPVPYSASNPVNLETGWDEQAQVEGRAWMYIEPDGDVRPTQGSKVVLGNILTDNWANIWRG